jgi:1-acyl-sn-glycerol-3-phosphate acyltransferase
VKVEMSGTENVSTDRAQVLVANHESWFDVFALAGHLPVGAKFVAKHVLERVPFFGGAWRACSHISIDRGDRTSAIQSLRDVGARIGRTGETVLMFPEGTRTTTGELQAFKKGAFVMALESRVPVVPVGISGSRDLMPKGSFRIRSGTVRVRIGEAIPVEGMSHEDRDRLTGLARDAVARLRVAGDIGTVRGEGSRGAIPSG